MKQKQKDSIEALIKICSYNKKLMKGIEQLKKELRGTKKTDTAEFLAEIINGIGWNIEILNQIYPIINEQEELLDKEKINISIISFNKALESLDNEKVAEALEVFIEPLILEINQISAKLS